MASYELNSDTSKVIRNSAIVAGIRLNLGNEKLSKYFPTNFTVFLPSILIIFWFLQLALKSDRGYFILVVAMVTQTLETTFSQIHFKRKWLNLRELLLHIDAGFYKYENEEMKIVFSKIDQKTKKKIQIFRKFWMCYIIMALFVYATNPVSYFFAEGGDPLQKLPTPGLFPWSVDGPISLAITSVYQLSCIAYTAAVFYLISILPGMSTLEFLAQFEKLKENIVNIRLLTQTHAFANYRKPNNNTKTSSFKYRLVESVRHHQALTLSFRHFKACYDGLFTVMLGGTFVAVTCFQYSLFQSQIVLVHVTNLPYNFAMLYLICFVGQLFSDMNAEIMGALREIDWFLLPPSDRKLLMIFTEQCRKEYTLTGFKIYSSSLAFYTSFTITSYRFLNFLISTF